MTDLRRFLFLPLVVLLAFSLQSAGASYDPLKEHLLKYLERDDPVRVAAYDFHNTIPAITLATASRQGDWKNEVFFSEKSYNYLLFAYMNGLVDRFEFTDIQDYLHILTDFKTPSTGSFNRIPVRIPAISIERVRMDQLEGTPYQSLITNSSLIQKNYPENAIRRPFPEKPDYWTTIVKVDPAFLAEAENDLEQTLQECEFAAAACMGQVVTQKERQFGMWLIGLAEIVPDLHHIGKDTIVFGSINQLLDTIHQEGSPYFLPVYGQLNWQDLLTFRTNGANPGTIYHPDCTSNFLEPHYLYSGATGFMRHDLFHQKLVNQLPEAVISVMALLHNAEEKAISEFNSHFTGLTDDGKDALYSGVSLKQPVLTQLLLGQINDREEFIPPPEHLSFSWQYPGQHEYMFPGYFADMAIVDESDNTLSGEDFLAEVILNGFTTLDDTLSMKFRSTVTFYIDRMLDTLIQHRDELMSSYALNVDKIIEELTTD